MEKVLGASSNQEWEKFGSTDPYFGVLSSPEFLSANLDEEARKRFFQMGENNIADVLDVVARHWDQKPAFEKALDFGCGVGRVLIPLARRWKSVVGVDVSPSMLREAEKNCREQNVSNVRFINSGDGLAGLEGGFDFIHSIIVFQHIPESLGRKLLERLIEALSPGGFGVLHVTYSVPGTIFSRMIKSARENVPFANGLFNILSGKNFSSPQMQMNRYDLGWIFRTIQNAGGREIFCQLSDHAGHLGSILFFRKGDS